jgi:hypothetical protein
VELVLGRIASLFPFWVTVFFTVYTVVLRLYHSIYPGGTIFKACVLEGLYYTAVVNLTQNTGSITMVLLLATLFRRQGRSARGRKPTIMPQQTEEPPL